MFLYFIFKNFIKIKKKTFKLFFQPLKDIAVVSGQTARFECIVQCEPSPNVFWTKNGQTIDNDYKYQIEYRNGVCRMTIPQAFQGSIIKLITNFEFSNTIFVPDDAGAFECVAQNPIGTDTTRAELIIPGDKRGFRIG